MKLINRVFVVYSFGLILLAAQSFAMDMPEPEDVACRSFEDDPNITICVNAEDWKHILYGEEREVGYSGGHDYGFYAHEHLDKNPDATVYFDRNMKAYIVSSTKGDSLPIIIDNLQAGRFTSYHTLFPSQVLTRSFVISAFEQALREPKSIDWSKTLFFTTIDGWSVAGFFKRIGNTFFIKSIFPDLSWYYRIEFLHHRHQPFAISRFLEWDASAKVWFQHGDTVDTAFDTLLHDEYLPEPIVHMLASTRGKGGNLSPEDFSLMAAARAYLSKNFSHKDISIFDLFFFDPAKPTQQEFDLLVATMNDYCPAFRFFMKSKDKKASVLRKYNLWKLEFKKKIKNDFLPIEVLSSECGELCLKDETLGQSGNVHGLHVGEEILFQSLTLMSNRERALKLGRTLFPRENQLERRFQGAEILANRFTEKLIQDRELLQKLRDREIVFQMRTVGKGHNVIYGLELISKKGLNENGKDEEMNQIGIFEVAGDHSAPFEITLIPFSLNQVKKIGNLNLLDT